MSDQQLHGSGFFGWLGRQVGYVKRAVQTDVTRQKIYENRKVEEVIVEKKASRT